MLQSGAQKRAFRTLNWQRDDHHTTSSWSATSTTKVSGPILPKRGVFFYIIRDTKTPPDSLATWPLEKGWSNLTATKMSSWSWNLTLVIYVYLYTPLELRSQVTNCEQVFVSQTIIPAVVWFFLPWSVNVQLHLHIYALRNFKFGLDGRIFWQLVYMYMYI